jgi:hypothetical protein
MSDLNQDNKLDAEEFGIMMHLIKGVKRGLSLPTSLPDVLKPLSGPLDTQIPSNKSPSATPTSTELQRKQEVATGVVQMGVAFVRGIYSPVFLYSRSG